MTPATDLACPEHVGSQSMVVELHTRQGRHYVTYSCLASDPKVWPPNYCGQRWVIEVERKFW